MHIARTQSVPWTCTQMQELVCDLEHYPLFLPGCRSARVLTRRPYDAGVEWEAELQVVVKGLQYRLKTRNYQVPNALHMSLLTGPFRQLEGSWLFRPEATGCEVSLQLQLEPVGLVLKSLLGLFADRAAAQVMDAFVKRAHSCFGEA